MVSLVFADHLPLHVKSMFLVRIKSSHNAQLERGSAGKQRREEILTRCHLRAQVKVNKSFDQYIQG